MNKAMVVSAIALLGVGPGHGADWRMSKGLTAGVLYTDNADTNDGESGGDSILNLTPYVRVDVVGNRSDAALSTRFNLKRHVDEDRTEISPQVVATSRTVLVERFATFEASARVAQHSIEANRLIDDAGSLNDETAATYAISLSPSIADSVTDRVSYSARYRFAATRGADDALKGSDQHGVETRFVVDAAPTPLAFLGGANYEVTRFETNETARATSVAAGIGYEFGPTLSAFVGAGYDHVRIDGIVIDASAVTYSTGLRYRPNERIEANIGYADRSFGHQPSASIRLSGRRSAIVLSWNRAANYADSSRLIDLADLAGAPSVPATGQVPVTADVGADSLVDTADGELIDNAVFSPLARDAATVDERVRLTYSVSGRLTVLTAGLAWANRTRNDTELTTEDRQYSVGAARKLSRRTDVVVRWSKLETRYSDERSLARENRYEAVINVAL